MNNTSKRSKGRAFAVNVLKTLEAPMRSSREPGYRSLDGLRADNDAVLWYWRVTAVASSVMILGGFLMLPATYVETSTLRVNQTAIGIFGIAILTAGFSFSALLTFTIRNPLFQAEAIHQPCGIASVVGLLTVFYHFIVSSTYTWKTPTLLLAIAAGLSTIIYAALFLLSQRRISYIRSQPRPADHIPLGSTSPARTSFTGPAVSTYEPTLERSSSYQPPGYYENYIRNMYPTSARNANSPPAEPTGTSTGDLSYDPHSISEEEMQRQQMLMLLLATDQPPQPSQQQSTYNIDWQGQDQETDDAPPHGYYAPGVGTGSSGTGLGAGTGASWPSVELPAPSRWGKLKMKPWDGVWRGVTRREESQRQNQMQQQQREQQQVVDGREERRREIELGLR